MTKPFIVMGDKTSHGGTVASGAPTATTHGKPIARLGDKVTCPKCGPTTIATGDSSMLVMGKPVARHGDKTACGATLIAGQSVTVVGAGSGGGTSTLSHPSPYATSTTAANVPGIDSNSNDNTQPDNATSYDEAFILISELTGKPLRNRNYKIIRENGYVEGGSTDMNGATHIVNSKAPELIRIEVEEEQAHA